MNLQREFLIRVVVSFPVGSNPVRTTSSSLRNTPNREQNDGRKRCPSTLSVPVRSRFNRRRCEGVVTTKKEKRGEGEGQNTKKTWGVDGSKERRSQGPKTGDGGGRRFGTGLRPTSLRSHLGNPPSVPSRVPETTLLRDIKDEPEV